MTQDLKSKKRCQEVLKHLYINRFADEKMNKLVKQNKGTTFFYQIKVMN